MSESPNGYFRQWLIKSPLGLSLIGLGVSLVGQAIIEKGQRRPAARWFWLGTLGLVVLNAGVSLFGDAVKTRTLLDWHRRHG